MTHCLGCSAIETAPVTLIDGTVVCSSCDAWRRETEARHILSMKPLSVRQAWLADIEKRRGKASADKLRADMMRLWEHRKPILPSS
jgi:hypothetical protein